MKPTIGRIVHFYNGNIQRGQNYWMGMEIRKGIGPYPAIITEVHSATMVDVTVFGYAGGTAGVISVPLVETVEGGEITGAVCVWPPREEEAPAKLSNTEKASLERQADKDKPA